MREELLKAYAEAPEPSVRIEILQDVTQVQLYSELSRTPVALPALRECTHTAVYSGPSVTIRAIMPCSGVGRGHDDHAMLLRVHRRLTALVTTGIAAPGAEIWYIPNTTARKFPAAPAPISQDHINGGYTYKHHREIYVYRREEFPKVMLHELLHHSKLDPGTFPSKDIARLRATFNISKESTLAPNEAFVELWAEVFTILFQSADKGVPARDIYKAEVKHALAQAARLLRYQRDHHPKWKESTNAYAYLVFRAIALKNLRKIPDEYTPASLTDFLIKHAADAQPSLTKTTEQHSARMTLLGDF